MQIKIFKKKKTFKKRNSEIDADYAWKIILYTTFFIMLIASVCGYYLFLKVNTDTAASESALVGNTGKVDKDRILKVLDLFTERENKSNTIINSPHGLADPSL